MKKRFLSVFLCLCLMVGMLPVIVPPALAYQTGDDYPSEYKNAAADSMVDRWNFYNRECTSFVAWCLNSRNGINFTNQYGGVSRWGHAKDWGGVAQSLGIAVDMNPAVGSIAWWNTGDYGHVAWVKEVNGDRVTIEEYNSWPNQYAYQARTISKSDPSGYIHINDIGGGSSSQPSTPSVTFSKWENPNYTYIRETDASIGQEITVTNGDCTETGMYLYNASGRELASARNGSYELAKVYFKINEECGYTLTPGTTYKYKFYAVVNGQTYWGGMGSFQTLPSSTSSQPSDPPPDLPANTSTEAEPNDTLNSANSISVNQEMAGSISKYSDVDWFVFQVPNDGHISITFDHDFVNSSNRYWETTFYTSGNEGLSSWLWKGNTTSAGTGSEIGVSAGTYYLRIRKDDYFSSATYRFTVNYTASDSWEREFNETIVTANPISTGVEISGSIMTNSDVDWYRFDLPNDGMISITFSHDFVNSSNRYWGTAFYTSNNERLSSWLWKGNTTSAGTGSEIGVSAGTYYLRIKRDDYFSSGTYRFTVNYTASDSWEQEFNETIVTANPISTGAEISGSIMNDSDVDWYCFDLPDDGTISITFSHGFVNSSNRYWETAFYTSDNKGLSAWLWKGNATSAGTGNEIGVSAGTYYLRIKRDDYFSSATYRFTVNFDRGGEAQKPVPASGITLNRSSLSLAVGSSAMLAATVMPSNTTDKTIVWRSENTSIAAVEDGKVIAVKEGSTRITASCGEVTAVCLVSVTAKEGQIHPSDVHFDRVNTYFQDQFTDVPANQWYTNYVAEAFELGLMKGNSKTTFNPYGDVRISEAITMAARIHSISTRGYENFQQTGDKWYQVYLDYAYKNGIISLAYYNCDVSQKASRAQFAEIFANSMPAEGLAAINDVADGAIPDVSMGSRYAEPIYKLYRAGILTGSDTNGTFNASTYITRAEAATIVSRIAESNNRVSITLP